MTPRKMPSHLFHDCRYIDYDSAVRADISRQNFLVCPRHWYMDASFRCVRCDNGFVFSAGEQRRWYEEKGFWIDSLPKHCLACRRDLREVRSLRKEYDEHIRAAIKGDDQAAKVRMACVIDQLCEFDPDLPERMHQNRRCLARQIRLGDTSGLK